MDAKEKIVPEKELISETTGESKPNYGVQRVLKTLLFASFVICWGAYFSFQYQPLRIPGLAARLLDGLHEANDASVVANDGAKAEETSIWLKEIATLMTELYELLSQMKYIKPGAVQYAPHGEKGVNVTLAKYIGLIPEAIDLLQLLPYTVTSPGPYYYFGHAIVPSVTRFSAWGYSNNLLLTTRFSDLRDDFTLRASRDPWNGGSGMWTDADVLKKEPWTVSYLKPWQVALSSSTFDNRLVASNGHAASVMVLDMKTRKHISYSDLPTSYYDCMT